MSTQGRNVFVSYSHVDAAWLQRLRVHLQPLVRRAGLDLWDDSKILPGQVWNEEIAKALDRASIAILMVSADFLASEFIATNELPPLLHRATAAGLLILSVIVAPCLFMEHEELSRYQSINDPRKPLSGMSPSDAEAAFVSLSRSIDKYLQRLTTSKVAPKLAVSAPDESRIDHDALTEDRPINLGFEGGSVDGMPRGWFDSFGHVSGVSTDYDIRVVPRSADPQTGTCVYLGKAKAAPDEFGSLMQRCPCRYLAGKTVRLEGELRAESIADWGGLWLRADGDEIPNLFFENMAPRPLRRTTHWARYFIDARLPADSYWLNYGIVLSGAGRLYADSLRILVWSAHGNWQQL